MSPTSGAATCAERDLQRRSQIPADTAYVRPKTYNPFVACTGNRGTANAAVFSDGHMEVTIMKTKARSQRDGYLWTPADLRKLKLLAKGRTPVPEVAKVLGRTPAAVQQKAMRSGIAFRR